LGRKTQLDLIGPNKARELRRGFNHLIQGTGADILRITLVRLNEALIGTQAKLKFCVHDSIYLEAKKEVSEEIGELASSIMEIEFKGVWLSVIIKIHNDFSMGTTHSCKDQKLTRGHCQTNPNEEYKDAVSTRLSD